MSLCVCMYVHVQVCHFGSLLTICVPGVKGYLSISIYLSIAKAHACHAKATGRAAETKERQRDTGGIPGRTSDPFAVHQVPRLPRTSHRQSGGDQGTPEGHRGVHPIPLQCTKSRTCHAKATGRAAETKGHRRDTGGTPEGHRRDTGSYIRPLCSAPSPACHAKATDRRDTGAYIRPLCSAPSLTPATQKPPAERRRPRDTGGTPIRPLCKSHRQSGGDQGTPEGHRGVHPTPLQCTKSHLPRKSHRQSGGDQGTPEGHWGVHLE